MHFRNLRVADAQPAAAGGIDQLPCLVPGRILERRTARAALDRLGRFAALSDFVHLGRNRRRIAWPAGKQRLCEDHVVGDAAMAVTEIQLVVAAGTGIAAASDAARIDQYVLGLAPIGAAIHAQRTTNAARNAAQERQSGDTRLLR